MQLDILTGDLPSICPVGRQVAWRNPGGADREMFDFRYKFDDPVTLRAIAAAVEVAHLTLATPPTIWCIMNSSPRKEMRNRLHTALERR
jgi:hypothetical protein